MKFNEVKQLVDILGSDEPGDHIQRQFTNPDVPETKIHVSIVSPQDYP